jgi:hypothetical protein
VWPPLFALAMRSYCQIQSEICKSVKGDYCSDLPGFASRQLIDPMRRFANIDFILGSAMACAGKDIETVNISYDIMCAYIVNFWTRAASWPTILLLPWYLIFRPFIPKFHLYAHGASCQGKFSLSYNSGVGRTHGESIEQFWAYIGIAATSTREMGPGLRQLVLEDMFGGSNHRKKVNLGKRSFIFDQPSYIHAFPGRHFALHLPQAIRLRDAYQDIAAKFSATFPEEVVKSWHAMVKAWQRDHSELSPFAEPEEGTFPRS